MDNMVKNNTGILIQARMSSKRLPGKSLLDLCEGLKVVDAVYNRCQQSIIKQKIIFCISENIQDDPLAEYLKLNGYKFFRGHGTNLVNRFMQACEYYSLDFFIRVTGDNPLVDPEIINYFCSFDEKIDFVDGYSPRELPNGTIVSRISYNILKFLNENEKNEYHLEHVVTSDLIRHKYLPEFKDEWKSPLTRFCIDYNEDYIFLIKLFKLKDILKYSTLELITLIKSLNPDNIKYANEGY